MAINGKGTTFNVANIDLFFLVGLHPFQFSSWPFTTFDWTSIVNVRYVPVFQPTKEESTNYWTNVTNEIGTFCNLRSATERTRHVDTQIVVIVGLVTKDHESSNKWSQGRKASVLPSQWIMIVLNNCLNNLRKWIHIAQLRMRMKLSLPLPLPIIDKRQIMVQFEYKFHI